MPCTGCRTRDSGFWTPAHHSLNHSQVIEGERARVFLLRVQEGGEGSERQRLSSAGEDEWMIEGVTPDMGTHCPSPMTLTDSQACSRIRMSCIAPLTLYYVGWQTRATPRSVRPRRSACASTRRPCSRAAVATA